MHAVEKILAQAAGKKSVATGEIMNCRVDLAEVNDLYLQTLRSFYEMGGKKVHDPQKITFMLDHYSPASTVQQAENQKQMREFCRDQGIDLLFDVGQGVCHQVMVDHGLVYPGMVLVATDSHTPTHGALGAFGTGVGATDMAVIMITGRLWFRAPEIIRINLDGQLRKGVYAKLHRPIEGRVKTLTVQRDAVGNWYACLACEVEPEPMPFNELAVGVDVGLESFATLSNGLKIENPRFFRHAEKELAKVQRLLSRAEKGTLERAKRRKAVQHAHQRIANRRKDFAHKLSRELVNNFGMIVFEDLHINNMLQNHCLAKSIVDASWNQLIRYTTYKAENAGRRVVSVDPRNTSKQCSCCGTMVEKVLSVRVHQCPVCGLIMDRDENASHNIFETWA